MIVLYLGSSGFCFVITRCCPPVHLVCSAHQNLVSPFPLDLGLIPCHRLTRYFVFFAGSQIIFFERSGVFYLHSMPRRPPPTPLLLVQGPLPPRGVSKFTMPSVPRPIFHPQTMVVAQRPVPRERVSSNRTGESGWRVEGGRESPSPSGHIGAMRL